MACFIVPATEAVVTTIAKKVVTKKEKSAPEVKGEDVVINEVKTPFSEKLSWLNKMLIGGSALLALEHVWHGEVIFQPPFLTAMKNAQDTREMLYEMSTTGVGMAAVVTFTWLGMVGISVLRERKKASSVNQTSDNHEI